MSSQSPASGTPHEYGRNADELAARRARNHRGNYCKTSSDRKDILIKCYEEGKRIATSAEIAGING